VAVQPQPRVPERLGRYRILRPLGRGGMGAVYLAQDTELDRQVALKVPHIAADDGSDVLQRFYREARAAATLRHPNICPLFDIGEFEGTPFLTMAYIEGKPLSELAPSKPLTQKSIALLVRKLALALQEAHRHGIIHRDLKPGNIMIDRRGEPIVMDFGLARRSRGDDTRLTQSGAAIGTPAYMPPEQIHSTAENVGPPCDIYSLGVILYELLTGRLPFEGDAMAILAQILTDEPQRPTLLRSDVDPALEAICLRAMAKKPAQRHGSMEELAGELLDFLRGKSPMPAPSTTRPVAMETAAGGVRMSMLGGLRSMAQAGLQLGKRRVPAANAPRKARRPKLPPWAWMAIGGGAMAVVMAVIVVLWVIFAGGAAENPPDQRPLAAHAGGPDTSGGPPRREPPSTRTEPTPPNRVPAANDEGNGGGDKRAPAAATETTPRDVIIDPKASLTIGLAALQGEWVVVSEVWKGRLTTEAEVKRLDKRFLFEGDQLTITRRGGRGELLVSRGRVQIGVGTFDFSGTHYAGEPRESRGLLELTGDTLRLAYPNINAGLQRPAAFLSTPTDDTLVVTATRAKGSAAVAASPPTGLAALQGEWEVISEVWQGKPNNYVRALVFEGSQLTFFRRNGPQTSRGKIDIRGGDLDFTGTGFFNAQPRAFRGIFEVTGDRLRLAYPNTNSGLIRPSAFLSSAQSDTLVIEARRKSASAAAAMDSEGGTTAAPRLASPPGRGAADAEGFTALFPQEGVPAGWVVSEWNNLSIPASAGGQWTVRSGVLHSGSQGRSWLRSEREYGDFILEFEVNLPAGGNSGVALRVPRNGHPAYDGMELQIHDNPAAAPLDATGAIFASLAPRKQAYRSGQWNMFHIELRGSKVKATINGEVVQDFDLDKQTQALKRPGGVSASPLRARARKGYLGFQSMNGSDQVMIRGARIRELQ
jgi:uncharacterized protein (TIGR03067 family)